MIHTSFSFSRLTKSSIPARLGVLGLCLALAGAPSPRAEQAPSVINDALAELLEASEFESPANYGDHLIAYLPPPRAVGLSGTLLAMPAQFGRVPPKRGSKFKAGKGRPSSPGVMPGPGSTPATPSPAPGDDLWSSPGGSGGTTPSWCDGTPDGQASRLKLGRCELKRGLVDGFKPMVSACALVSGYLGDEVTARFSIRGSSGRIDPSTIELSRSYDPKFRSCVVHSLGQLRFPTFSAASQGVKFTARL